MARTRTPSVLLDHQATRLTQICAQGQFTDASLAAFVEEVDKRGETFDRSMMNRWRGGEHPAPLGLVNLILHHVDDKSLVLNLYARDHGLRVVADEDLEADDRGLTDRVLELTGMVGELARETRAAEADGRIDDHERESLLFTGRRLAQEVAELLARLERQGAA